MIVDGDISSPVCFPCDRKALVDEFMSLRSHVEKLDRSHASDIEALRFEISQLKIEFQSSQCPSSGPITPTPITPSSGLITPTLITPSYSEILKPPSASTNGTLLSDFVPVKNGRKPALKSNFDLPKFPTKNRFSPLQRNPNDPHTPYSSNSSSHDVVPQAADSAATQEPTSTSKDPPDVVLVGDSMLHGQKDIIRKIKRSRIFSYGGASLCGKKRLINNIDNFTKSTDINTLFVVHVGTNDLLDKNYTPHEIVVKYKELLNSIREKSKSNQICLLGLFPVVYESLNETSDRKSLNILLHELANEQNCLYLSVWEQFAHDPSYESFFNKGGLHLSDVGTVKLGNLLKSFVRNFQCIPLNQFPR